MRRTDQADYEIMRGIPLHRILRRWEFWTSPDEIRRRNRVKQVWSFSSKVSGASEATPFLLLCFLIFHRGWLFLTRPCLQLVTILCLSPWGLKHVLWAPAVTSRSLIHNDRSSWWFRIFFMMVNKRLIKQKLLRILGDDEMIRHAGESTSWLKWFWNASGWKILHLNHG